MSGIFFSISVILVLKSIFLTDPLVSSIFLSTLQSFSLNFFFSIILWFISKFSCAMNFTPNIINLCKLLIIHCFFDIINYITDSSYSNRLEQLLICDSLIYQYPLSAKSTFFANNDVSIPVAFYIKFSCLNRKKFYISIWTLWFRRISELPIQLLNELSNPFHLTHSLLSLFFITFSVPNFD